MASIEVKNDHSKTVVTQDHICGSAKSIIALVLSVCTVMAKILFNKCTCSFTVKKAILVNKKNCIVIFDFSNELAHSDAFYFWEYLPENILITY